MEQKRYIFVIKARNGAIVKNLRFMAPDYDAAEKKLVGIYRYCEILETHEECINQKASSQITHTKLTLKEVC